MDVELCETDCWDVVRLDDDGKWETVLSGVTYNDADNYIDRLTDQFPHAIIDITHHA